jgi:hypothetical protein
VCDELIPQKVDYFHLKKQMNTTKTIYVTLDRVHQGKPESLTNFPARVTRPRKCSNKIFEEVFGTLAVRGDLRHVKFSSFDDFSDYLKRFLVIWCLCWMELFEVLREDVYEQRERHAEFCKGVTFPTGSRVEDRARSRTGLYLHTASQNVKHSLK